MQTTHLLLELTEPHQLAHTKRCGRRKPVIVDKVKPGGAADLQVQGCSAGPMFEQFEYMVPAADLATCCRVYRTVRMVPGNVQGH